MWIKPGSRQSLLELLSNKAGLVKDAKQLTNKELRLASSEMNFVWKENPQVKQVLPHTILVSGDSQREFLAWAATFLPTFSPFTAFFRVLDISTFRIFSDANYVPTLEKLENVCSALIIAEALGQGPPNTPQRKLSLSECLGTLSYTMARAFALELTDEAMEQVIPKWLKLRTLGITPSLFSGIEPLRQVWDMMSALKPKSRHGASHYSPEGELILEVCLDIQREGKVSAEGWKLLSREVPEVPLSQTVSRETREERVLSFEAFLGNLKKGSNPNNTLKSFVCGYLASQIGPGTLDHLPFLAQSAPELASAIYWYAVCAGLHPQSEVQKFGGGIGRRIARELLAPDTAKDNPRSDIAMSELEVLLGGDNPQLEFLTTFPGQLSVELFPGIAATIAWPPNRGSHVNRGEGDYNRFEIEDIVRQLGETLEESQRTHRKLMIRVFGNRSENKPPYYRKR